MLVSLRVIPSERRAAETVSPRSLETSRFCGLFALKECVLQHEPSRQGEGALQLPVNGQVG